MGDTTRRFVRTVQGVLEQMLASAAADGERAWSWLRITVGGVLVVLHLARFSEDLLGGEPREVVTFSAVAVSILGSMALLRWMQTRTVTRRLLAASLTLDGVILGITLLASVLWPYPGWSGLPRHPQVAFLYLVTAASGLRLSRQIAIGGGLGFTSLGAALLVLDRSLNAALQPPQLIDLFYAVILQAAAAAFGITIATRTLNLVFDGARATMRAERARQHLGAYVSEEIAAVALEEDELQLGGLRQQAAVLFTDLRGFTHYTEHLDPERVVGELNEYLEAMVSPIRAEGGVIDKYIGDSIMAVFGVPAAQGDEAARAIRAADAMNHALGRLNRHRVERGLDPLDQGIGVHFGPVVAGNVGTRARLQYTVIGDTVNTASRLESSTKGREESVLISAAAVAAAEGQRLPKLSGVGALTLRGRDAPLEVYTLS